MNLLIALMALLPVALCLTINTPASLVECQPTSITWSGATSPVYVAVLKGGDTSSEALKQLGEVPSGSSVTWMVDVPAGTSVTLSVTDSKGVTQYSSEVTVMAGASTSCLGGNSSSSSTTSPSSAPTSGGSASASSASSTPSSTSDATTALQIGGRLIAVVCGVGSLVALLA